MRRHEDFRNIALIIAAGAVGAAGTAMAGSLLRPNVHLGAPVSEVQLDYIHTDACAGHAEPGPVIYVDGVRLIPASCEDRFLLVPSVDPSKPRRFRFPSAAELNPDDVARIEIVKGPSAAKHYGSDARGGVIHVFLKEGKKEGGKSGRAGASGAGADSGRN